MLDLYVDGRFFARRTNDPPIKGLSVNNIKVPHASKPIMVSDTDAAAAANLEALGARLAELPQEVKTGSRQIVAVFGELPAGRKRLELYLPEKTPVRLHELKLEGGGARVPAAVPVDDRRPLLVAYGSSITQGMPFSHGASRTWPVVAGRAADLRVMNLGVGGQCHFDQAMARHLRDTRADCFVFCLGINVHNLGSMSARTVVEGALGFLSTVRDGHPETPICVISPIWGGFREAKSWQTDVGRGIDRGATVPSLLEWRALLSSAVQLLQQRGDKNLHYVDGLKVMGEDMAASFPDDLHPNGDGYERMGLRIAELAFGPNGLLLPGRVPEGTAAAKPERPSASDFVDWLGKSTSSGVNEANPAKAPRCSGP